VPVARSLGRGEGLKCTKANTPCDMRARASLKRLWHLRGCQRYKAPWQCPGRSVSKTSSREIVTRPKAISIGTDSFNQTNLQEADST
jgi:hypothetical protein